MAVVFKADSDFSKVLKDYERLQAKNVQLENKMRDVTKEVRNQGTGMKAVFEGGVGQLKSMLGGYASLQGAISLVNQGLEEQKRLANEAHRVQMSAADAQAEVIRKLGDVTPEVAANYLKDIEKISQKTGMESVAPVLQAAANTLSAVPDAGLTKVILEKTLPLFKSKPFEASTYAGAVGDLAKISGAKTGEDIERLLSLVMSSDKYSRGVSLESFEEVAKTVAAVSAVDTGSDRIRSIKEGMAFSAAISSAIADTDLAITKTATSEVATALAELLPEKDLLDAEGQVKRRGTGLKTMADRLARVQADPALQRRFFETGEGFQMASFRGPVTPVIRQLVSDPNSPIAKATREAFAGISDDVGVARRMFTSLESATPELERATVVRKAKGNVQAYQLGDNQGQSAAAHEIVGAALEKTRPGLFGFIEDKLFTLTRGAEMTPQEGISALRTRERHLRMPHYMGIPQSLVEGIDPYAKPRSDEELSSDERSKIELLHKQVTLLEKLLAAQEKANSQPGQGAVAAAQLRLNSEGR